MSQNSNGFCWKVSFLSSAYLVLFFQRFPVCSAGEEPTCNAGDAEVSSIPGLGIPPWGVKRQTAPISLPGASQGYGSLVDHSPEGQKVRQPERPHTGQPWCYFFLGKLLLYSYLYVFSILCNLKRIRLSVIYFLFFSLLLSQLSIVQKQMTPKLSHLKQLLSPGSGGWVGLGDFLMSGQGVGQSWGSCHLSMSGRLAGAVGQNTCMWPASWSGFLTAWHWVQAWMSPR